MKTPSMLRRAMSSALAASLLVVSTSVLAAPSTAPVASPYLRPGVSFALLGDTPYGANEEALMSSMTRSNSTSSPAP